MCDFKFEEIVTQKGIHKKSFDELTHKLLYSFSIIVDLEKPLPTTNRHSKVDFLNFF